MNLKSQTIVQLALSLIVPLVALLNSIEGLEQLWYATFLISGLAIVGAIDVHKNKREIFISITMLALFAQDSYLFLLNKGAITYLFGLIAIPVGAIVFIDGIKLMKLTLALLVLAFVSVNIIGIVLFKVPPPSLVISCLAFVVIYRFRIRILNQNKQLLSQKSLIESQLIELNHSKEILEHSNEQLQEAAQKIEETSEQLSIKNAHLEEFTYIVSHDLKTPIRGIHNYSNFLLEDYESKLEPEGIKMLDGIKKLTKKMDLLISELLSFAKLEKVEPDKSDVNLADPLSALITDLSIIPDHEIEVKYGPMPTVLVDKVRIKELFLNFVTNAFKYNTSSEKLVEFTYSEETKTLSVRDNGIGIAKEDFNKVFAFFKRIHGENEYGGGTGAGMSIAKKICDSHNIPLTLESEVGKGTTFKMYLGNVLAD